MKIKFVMNTMGSPAGKLCDAEIHIDQGVFPRVEAHRICHLGETWWGRA